METDFHKYWVCEDNATIDHPDVRATQSHAKRIVISGQKIGYAEGLPIITTERDAQLCRGLTINEIFLPHEDDAAYHDHPYPVAGTCHFSEFPPDPHLMVYTDASGGPNNQWAHLRIVGQASVIVHPITHHCLWVLLGGGWGWRS